MATTVEQVTEKARELGFGWVVSNMRAEDNDQEYWDGMHAERHISTSASGGAREYAEDIVRSVDGNQAPGSETSLLGDALDNIRHCPEGDIVSTLDWFLRAYTAQEKLRELDADDDTLSQFYEYLFSGSLEAAEEMVAA